MTSDLRLRVVVFSAFPPGGGGGEIQTQAQLAEIVRQGHDVTVIDLRSRDGGPREEMVEGMRVVRLRVPPWPVLRALAFHLRLARATLRHGRRADVAQFNHIGSALLTAGGLLGILGVPRVVVIWGSAAPGVGPFGSSLKLRAARWMARRFERCVALATLSTGHLVADGFPADRIAVVPNGVDTDRFRPRDTGPGGAPVVVTVGRLVPAKGLDVLLRAWSGLRQDPPGARLVLVGDGPLRADLERRRAELGLDDRVDLPGSRRDVPECLRSADVYVSASRTEGMSNALLEAMSAGLPIVATRVGAAEDLLEDGVSGLLVPPGDPAALTAALARVLSDAGLRASLGRAARERAVREFSIGSVGRRYVALYAALRTLA